MQKEIPYKFPFASSSRYHKASPDFNICTEHPLKLSTQGSLTANISYKDSYPFPSEVTGAEVLLYSMLELPKGLKIFERKDPHGSEEALCSTAESKESNMPNLLLTTI